jgi:hypothetical protein
VEEKEHEKTRNQKDEKIKYYLLKIIIIFYKI